MRYPKYSVLMSVYKKEKAEYLRAAMDSMWNQTIPTNDFVLVCDGPLTEELECVIADMQSLHYKELNVIRLSENRGLGYALNVGMNYCKNELIARMDSDDISKTDRCERQLLVFMKQEDISIVSGTVEEFFVSTNHVDARRVLPEKHEDIMKFAQKRNPFNHPCTMYKKEAVEMAGGYIDFYLLEDYHLWVRMLQKGCVAYNIPQSLLWMRAGSDMYKRRAGLKYAKSQNELFNYMKKTHFISPLQYYSSTIIRTVSSMIPNSIRQVIYKKVMRVKKQDI